MMADGVRCHWIVYVKVLEDPTSYDNSCLNTPITIYEEMMSYTPAVIFSVTSFISKIRLQYEVYIHS